MQIELFEVDRKSITMCKCCRKRPSVDDVRCQICIESWSPKLHLADEWERAIESRQSGLRQRAKHKGSNWAKRSELREKLIEQDYKCFFTGRPLAADKDLRLAHLTPASSGGSFQIENLVWTTHEVNHCMNTLGYEDFIQLCMDVSSEFRRRLDTL